MVPRNTKRQEHIRDESTFWGSSRGSLKMGTPRSKGFVYNLRLVICGRFVPLLLCFLRMYSPVWPSHLLLRQFYLPCDEIKLKSNPSKTKSTTAQQQWNKQNDFRKTTKKLRGCFGAFSVFWLFSVILQHGSMRMIAACGPFLI